MAAQRSAGEPVRVLVADDDDETRAVLVRLLDSVEEIEVVGAASNLAAAGELVADSQPDVVLLDRVMPGVTGPSAVDALRLRAPDAAIVVLSGYGRDDPEVAALAAAADGYLEKGAPRAALVRAVRHSAGVPPSAAKATPTAVPSLAALVEALHDGPVQSLSGSLWTLDALSRARDDARREELVEQLRTSLQTSLDSTRRLMRWARGGSGSADPPR